MMPLPLALHAVATTRQLTATGLVMIAALSSPAQAEITNAPAATKTPINVETVASGLRNPWGLQFLPDGRFLVTERPGNMRIVNSNGKVSDPLKGVPKVAAVGQGGLLDVRLAPDFSDTGIIYFSYSEPHSASKRSTTMARAKLVLEDGGGRLENIKILFRQKQTAGGGHHFGSRIVLAKDGTIFVTTGDRARRSSDVQNPATHIGKVIRINPDGTAPADNPAGQGGDFADWAPEVWSMGHRNMQGAALDTKTGQLWTIEHGARGGDELNHPEKGKNYGWPVISYGRHYSGAKIGLGTSKDGMEQPVYYWDPSIAVSGLAIYRGRLFDGWDGNFLVGGLAGAHINRLVMKDGKVIAQEQLLAGQGKRVRDVRVGPEGAVYVLTDQSNGELLKLTPAK